MGKDSRPIPQRDAIATPTGVAWGEIKLASLAASVARSWNMATRDAPLAAHALQKGRGGRHDRADRVDQFVDRPRGGEPAVDAGLDKLGNAPRCTC